MSDTINHAVFGKLEIETEDDELQFSGEITIGDNKPWPIFITGTASSAVEEILSTAAAAHEIFVSRVPEIREMAVRNYVDEDRLNSIRDMIREGTVGISDLDFDPTTIDGAIRNFNDLFTLCYHTHVNEVSAVFEDSTGLYGPDLNVQSNLTFSEVYLFSRKIG